MIETIIEYVNGLDLTIIDLIYVIGIAIGVFKKPRVKIEQSIPTYAGSATDEDIAKLIEYHQRCVDRLSEKRRILEVNK